jgi:hypothetical protein
LNRGRPNSKRRAKRLRSLREHLWYAKRDARNRGIAWQIKDEDALPLFKQPCHWCGAAPNPANGIDRRNNELYYRKSNALPCCWPCNLAKRKMRADEWATFVHRITRKIFADIYAPILEEFFGCPEDPDYDPSFTFDDYIAENWEA